MIHEYLNSQLNTNILSKFLVLMEDDLWHSIVVTFDLGWTNQMRLFRIWNLEGMRQYQEPERIHSGYRGGAGRLACTSICFSRLYWQQESGCVLPSVVLPFSSLIILPSYQFYGASYLYNKTLLCLSWPQQVSAVC